MSDNSETLNLLSSMFPHVPCDKISYYLQFYSFDDTVFTLERYYSQNEESENQNDSENSSDSIIQEEQDEKISSILQDFPDLSANDCLLLLEESNFDVEKAKRNAFANFQYQKEMEEANQKTYLKILKEEFPQVDESILLNALETFNNDYFAAKSTIQDNISLNKPHKTKKNLLNSDGSTIESPSSPKRPRKVKRISQLYPNILTKNENKNKEQLLKSNQKQEYQTNDNNDKQTINETEEFQESNLNENQTLNSSQKVYQNPTFITLNNFRKKQKTDYYDEDEDMDDDDIDEMNFYRNMMPKKSSKCSVKKTNRMPERYYIPQELCVKEIDFHGMKAEDVHERVIRELKNAKNSNIGTFHFITGAGHHSQDNTPTLKPLVLNLCQKWGYKPTLTRDGGCVVCKIR